MKYLSFDIEIVKELPEDEDWEQYRPLGISCAATIRSEDNYPIRWFTGQDKSVPREGGMSKPELLKLIDYMDEQMSFGFIPLTWNGLKFDFDILAEESGDTVSCRKLALNHVDMMFHFFCLKGYPLSLKAASEGMKLEGKMEGMSGALAPSLWQNNNERLIELDREDLTEMTAFEQRYYVMEYVGQDVIATLRLAEAIDKAGQLNWTSKKGRPNSAGFRNGFLTVSRALKLPRPSTSWMSDPIKRESFYEWVKK
jgi:hypothetical protein